MWEAIVKISWVYFLSCAVVLYDAFPVSLVTTGIYIYIYSLEEGPPLGEWEIVAAFVVCFYIFWAQCVCSISTLLVAFGAPLGTTWATLSLWVSGGGGRVTRPPVTPPPF